LRWLKLAINTRIEDIRNRRKYKIVAAQARKKTLQAEEERQARRK